MIMKINLTNENKCKINYDKKNKTKFMILYEILFSQ